MKCVTDSTNTVSVLHVGKYYPPATGGIENFLVDLIGNQAWNGIKVAAVVHEERLHRSAATPATHPDSAGLPPVSLYRAPALGRLLYAPVSPAFPLWLRRALRTERPDILHLHLPNTSAFWALLLPEARRLPWVIHWHADVVPSDVERRLRLAYPVYRRFEQRLLRRAAAVIATSPPYLTASRALTPWHDKCRVVPLGLDPSRIPAPSPRARRQAESLWGTAAFRILAVGRLTYYKGFEYLLRAMPEVNNGRAVIVGSGERRQTLESEIERLELDERAILTGSLSAVDLHALMQSCDCICLPSIERTEAFGMVLLEAMAHGKPAVVSDVPGSGVGWVVRNGENGIVVPPAESTALSTALRSLRDERTTSLRMGRRGRQRYEAEFRIDQVSRKVIELYKEICDV